MDKVTDNRSLKNMPKSLDDAPKVQNSSGVVDTMLYNEKSLNLLTIRDLRDIGRKFGVPSPTTLSKDELISYILKIVYGEVSAPARKPMGRPNVREFNLEGYLERIRKNAPIAEELSKVRLYNNNSLGTMKVSSPGADHGNCLDQIETRVLCEIDGKLYLRENAYLKNERDIEVSKELAKKFNLENYDVLEIVENKGQFKIVTINGKLIENKYKGLSVDGKPLVSGLNQVFYMSTKDEIKQNVENIEKVCEKNGLDVLIFSENKYTGKTTKYFGYSKDEENSVIYKKFMGVLVECERMIAECVDVVLVIEDMGGLDDILSTFDPEVSYRIKTKIGEEIYNIARLGNVCVKFCQEVPMNY